MDEQPGRKDELEKREQKIWRRIGLSLSVLYGILMFPLLWIAKYNHMCADDFGYGEKVHLAWLETGSIFEVIKTAAKVAVDYYDWWQGTFSSLFLMALQPGVFGERFYFLGALFLFAVFHAAVIYLVYTIVCKIMGADKGLGAVLTVVLLVVMIQRMDSPVGAFYFYNAGVHYIFMASILLFLVALQLRVLVEKKRRKCIFYCLMQVALGVILGGGNYITAFFYLLLSVTYFAICAWKREKKALYALPGFLAEAAAFAVSAMAPGNAVRQEQSNGLGAFEAILLSFRSSLEYMNGHIDLITVLVLLLMLPVLWEIVRKTRFSFPLPGVVIGYTYCLYAAIFTPTCFAMGGPGPGRCRNMYSVFLVLTLFFLEGYVLGWLSKRITVEERGAALPAALAGGVICCFIAGLVLVQDPNAFMSLSAAKSMWYKEAQLYHVIHLEREAQLKESEGKRVEIRSCQVKPYLLYFDDIVEDPKDWRNVAMAKWYQKKSVTLKAE